MGCGDAPQVDWRALDCLYLSARGGYSGRDIGLARGPHVGRHLPRGTFWNDNVGAICLGWCANFIHGGSFIFNDVDLPMIRS